MKNTEKMKRGKEDRAKMFDTYSLGILEGGEKNGVDTIFEELITGNFQHQTEVKEG